MLRRSAARAFGSDDADGPRRPERVDAGLPRPIGRRSEAVQRLFDDLLDQLRADVARRGLEAERRSAARSPRERGAAEQAAAGAPDLEALSELPEATDVAGEDAGERAADGARARGGEEDLASAGADSPRCPLTISGPRTELSGYEFVLAGAGGRVRVTNTLGGFLLVRHETGGALVSEDLVTVQRQAGGYRPIVKRLLSGGQLAGPPRPRVAFRFSSVPELAHKLVLAAAGD